MFHVEPEAVKKLREDADTSVAMIIQTTIYEVNKRFNILLSMLSDEEVLRAKRIQQNTHLSFLEAARIADEDIDLADTMIRLKFAGCVTMLYKKDDRFAAFGYA